MANRFERTRTKLEDKSLEFRSMVERSYSIDPKSTASELTYMGYWAMAAQLKIDHQSGKL